MSHYIDDSLPFRVGLFLNWSNGSWIDFTGSDDKFRSTDGTVSWSMVFDLRSPTGDDGMGDDFFSLVRSSVSEMDVPDVEGKSTAFVGSSTEWSVDRLSTPFTRGSAIRTLYGLSESWSMLEIDAGPSSVLRPESQHRVENCGTKL